MTIKPKKRPTAPKGRPLSKPAPERKADQTDRAVRGQRQEVQEALESLKRAATKRDRDNITRFGINARRAIGVSMANLKTIAKRIGRNHALAGALWNTGWYEARMLATLVDEPERVTPAQMDRWCRDFDNWGICDTACFALFDRTPHAWRMAATWCGRNEEFVKRAGFALLWGLTVHDKLADDEQFVRGLRLVEGAASDDRHFVRKSVNMALRAIGKRNAALNGAAVTVARRLAESPHLSARWIGQDALRELTSAAVVRRLAGRGRSSTVR